ncbi:hypothetical protein SAMN04487948_111123 [Halogranum amylolyticum]|uniref:Uncharacterized protein n=1 Tax=Halogranum amylolyticum TaxID=660520 RepID=A0A1H8ULP8_9EURY|nr:hypothetical protein [Halogranum amylolyticum]SEP03883.1 hypothetical protein SAMN04487948_111123 [Halogranum amylolyticum]
MRNSQTPLTPREEDAFECLREVVDGMDAGCPRAAAIEAVVALEFDRDEAVYLVDQLLLKGYLYAVGDEIRVTD